MCYYEIPFLHLSHLWQVHLSLVAKTLFKGAFAFGCVVYDTDNEY